MLVIGLGHKARQGKEEVAQFIKELDPKVKVYGFADELKTYCKEHHQELYMRWHTEHPGQIMNAPKEDPIYGYTQILQWYGTDVARKENPECWIQALDRRLRGESPRWGIVTDVRFENEAAFVKEKGGYMVNVRRLNADGSQFLDAGRDPRHESETALDDYEYDFVIEVKNGDLHSLKKQSIGVWNIVNNPELFSVDLADVPVCLPSIDECAAYNFGDEPDERDNYEGGSFKDSDSTGFK